jgi:hypothetical protein
MNKYIIILIVIILLVLIYILSKNNEHYGSESLINIFAPCKDTVGGTVGINNLNITGVLQLGSLKVSNFKQYLLDVIYPIGAFYVQYPDINTNEPFPVSKSPGKLFGGDWQEQWNDESVFFRTRGSEATEDRVNGFQEHAIKVFWGKTQFTQTNRWTKQGDGVTGIFGGGVTTHTIGTDYGKAEDVGHVNYFDNAAQSNVSELETRVRNRQIKVWKRIKRENNGAMPPPPENGKLSQYDNIYYDGPYPNNSFANAKAFNVFDYINTKDKAMEKCNALGDACKNIGLTLVNDANARNHTGEVYDYSSDDAVMHNYYGDNRTRKIWKKKKLDTVL